MKSLIVHLEIKPDYFDEFISIAMAHGQNSLAKEGGCQRFEVMLPQDEPNTVILVEVYKDDAAIESHLQSEHMAEYLRKTGAMILDRRRYRCRVLG